MSGTLVLISSAEKTFRIAENRRRILTAMKPLEIVAAPGPGVADRVFSPPQVDIVVPVKDEERDLDPSVRRLCAFLRDEFPFSARITIADNGSTDHTWAVATGLSREFPAVTAVHMEQPGRGRALRAIGSGSGGAVRSQLRRSSRWVRSGSGSRMTRKPSGQSAAV